VSLGGPTDLFQAAASCDILLEQPCAGTSACGRCRVRVIEGAAAPSREDVEALSRAELQGGWRLGCALTLTAPATIEVPRTSRAVPAKAFGSDTDPAPDRLPVIVLPEPSAAGPWALAVDIGTTTLAAALVNLRSGRVDASRTSLNPQAERGADIMSRIHFAGGGDANRGLLESAVRGGIAALAARMTAELGIDPAEIVAAAVVGNPTMLHLWYGADPSGLGVAPYLGLWTAALHRQAQEVELPIAPSAPVYVLPCIRSHVGADAVAASVAVGIDTAREMCLLVDLGTNSELVLGNVRGALAASTSAGPAFECGGISCGMRAGDGAIDAMHLEPDGRWSVHVIGNAPPAGICGSGLLDAVAELLRVGLLDETGYLRAGHELGVGVPEGLVRRLGLQSGRRSVAIVEDTGGPSMALLATDIRQLQLATGAIRAGIDILCAEAGVDPEDLASVFVAGAFGGFVRKRSLLRLGMLPDVPAERVQPVGNAAGLGARLALLDTRFRVERMGRLTRYVELAGRADYQDALTRRLRFPGPAATRE
jgi:uncharacterized 2Fe-2S/4Fe-4S cluster protein (DUF4445 family)